MKRGMRATNCSRCGQVRISNQKHQSIRCQPATHSRRTPWLVPFKTHQLVWSAPTTSARQEGFALARRQSRFRLLQRRAMIHMQGHSHA